MIVRKIRRIAQFSFGTIANYGLLSLDPRQKARPRETRDRWVQAWAQGLLRAFNVSVLDGSRIPTFQSALVVANHRAALDVPLLLSRFGGRIVGRGDLADWPLLGKPAKGIGTLFLDRTDLRSALTTMREMETALRSGDRILLFPEGTTFADDEVRPFAPGSFLSAIRANVPVVPVGIAYKGDSAVFVGESFGKHLWRASATRSTEVAMVVGEPMSFSRKEASIAHERVRERVQLLVLEARKQLG